MKKDIVQTVLAKRTENNGVFIPSALTVNQPVYFAIDHVDLAIDTPDGKKQLHGTGTSVYQQKSHGLKVHTYHNFDEVQGSSQKCV